MSNFPIWAAIRTVKSRIGTWKGYDLYRTLVPGLEREEWARAIGQARAAVANRVDEITRPLNRRPTGTEITPLTRVTGSGFWQHTEIYVKDRDTGIVGTRYFTVKTDTLRSRLSVINEVMGRYQDAIDSDPENYPEDVVGVAYTGTYQILSR